MERAFFKCILTYNFDSVKLLVHPKTTQYGDRMFTSNYYLTEEATAICLKPTGYTATE